MMEEHSKRRRPFEQPVLFSHMQQTAPASAAPPARREAVREEPIQTVSPEELLMTRWTAESTVCGLDLLAAGEQLTAGQIGALMKRHAASVSRGDYKHCTTAEERRATLAEWLQRTLPQVGAKLKHPPEAAQPRRRSTR